MSVHPLVSDAQVRMKKAIDHTAHEFGTINTGKASPSMVENVFIDAYGSQMRIKDCAAITTPDPRMIVITPWDNGLTKAIEKGIQLANIGMNPSIDGKLVRVPLPDMSRDRRLEFVKVAHKMAEEGRVHLRNVRRDVMESLKKAKLPEDETKRLEKEIQTLTDKSIKEVESHLASKEKELLAV
jgi:ribosome recycling factor